MSMKSRQNNVSFSVVLALSVLAAAGAVFAYVQLFNSVRVAVVNVAAAAEEARLLSIQNEHTQTVRRVVRDTEKERMELSAHFTAEEEIVSLLADFEGLQDYTGIPIRVDSVRAGSPMDKDGRMVPLELSLSSEGTFRQVLHMLAMLEVFPKALSIANARITQHPTSAKWMGDFDVVVLTIAEPQDN